MHARPRCRHLLLKALAGVALGWSLSAAGPAARAADEQPNAAPPSAIPAYRQANHVAVLTVQGEIDLLTLRSLERRVEEAARDGASAIVLDLDTPGGRLDAALDICHLLKTDAPTNSVVWVNPNAYSAGTIIGLACREIVVSPNATFGDAAPIRGIPVLGLMQMAPAERAKIESPLLAEIVDSARRNHYDENLVRAFVSVGIELWLLEHTTTGERVFVDRAEYEAVFGDQPPDQFTSVTPPPAPPGAVPVSPFLDPFRESLGEDIEIEEEIDPEQLEKDIQFAQSLPPSRDRLTDAERGQWRLLTQVVAADQLLTVKTPEAVGYGLVSAIIANDAQLKAYFGAQQLTRYDETWSEGLVRFLVSTPVRGLLIVVFLIALFIEISAPGLGVFGATALVALAILVGAPYLVGLAGWWEILLIVAGLALVMLELFVIPGLGIAGIAGALCVLVGLVGTFVSGDLAGRGQTELWTGVITTLTSFFAAGVIMWFISRQLHTIPVVNRLVLRAELKDDGPAGAAAAVFGGAPRVLEPGDLGVVETDLRPAGRVNFDGRLVDVKSVGPFIEKGAPVRVVSVGRFVIEVEEATS